MNMDIRLDVNRDPTLAAWALRTSLDARPVEVGLLQGDTEIHGAGYKRFRVRPSEWQWDGPAARVTARFGPFTSVVDFSAVALFDGSELVEVVHRGPVRCSGTYELEVTLEPPV